MRKQTIKGKSYRTKEKTRKRNCGFLLHFSSEDPKMVVRQEFYFKFREFLLDFYHFVFPTKYSFVEDQNVNLYEQTEQFFLKKSTCELESPNST